MAALTLAVATQAPAAAQRPPIIAAASDLQFALEAIAPGFTKQTGERVELVFGSSGNLTRQVMAGAPFELFWEPLETACPDWEMDTYLATLRRRD